MASKSAVALLMVNLALFAFVSANATATCPDLNACINIADGLVNAELGGQSGTPCCELIHGIADADLALCLCSSLQNTPLGSTLGVLINLLGGLLGGLTGNSLLNKELLVILNSCGYNNASLYKCY
ncbi:hypothetical protein SOVF_119750 [Spinacia oleracea]|uniref:Hydrophobic seed protein-like n=1 Tax=Spinacia oleracea TaxID=3562 RepID=A0A9R0J108_SPIOL|nr:hydrophobic seed protein-like [Spinacia oleracea]XP_021858558.2 hydrophobic seed protein-like [Spinacia oleracea]KNA13105.1 hypothetical protein SOVF_119750 [Spinacia oleracea]